MKYSSILLLGSMISILFHGGHPPFSTTSVVTIIGGIVSSQQDEVSEKHKRKDCPVCKGKGWYMSGDGIAKIQCNYCEP